MRLHPMPHHNNLVTYLNAYRNGGRRRHQIQQSPLPRDQDHRLFAEPRDSRETRADGEPGQPVQDTVDERQCDESNLDELN